MRLRMKETKSGSPNGVAIFSYFAGQEYSESSNPRLSSDLAEVFLAEGWAEEVANAAASFPTDAAPAPVAAPGAPAAPAAPVAPPVPEPPAAPAPEVPLAPAEKPAPGAAAKKSVGADEPAPADTPPA